MLLRSHLQDEYRFSPFLNKKHSIFRLLAPHHRRLDICTHVLLLEF